MNRDQFIQLVTGEQESLRRFLLAKCAGNREEMEEIAQTALVKAYLAFDRYEPRCAFSTWLFKIAYNVFLDHKRKPSGKFCEPSENMSGGEDADSSFRYQDLYAALEQLPEKEQTAILLFYIKGYTVKEIAEITGGSESAVKTRLSRGREQLRRVLENE